MDKMHRNCVKHSTRTRYNSPASSKQTRIQANTRRNFFWLKETENVFSVPLIWLWFSFMRRQEWPNRMQRWSVEAVCNVGARTSFTGCLWCQTPIPPALHLEICGKDKLKMWKCFQNRVLKVCSSHLQSNLVEAYLFGAGVFSRQEKIPRCVNQCPSTETMHPLWILMSTLTWCSIKPCLLNTNLHWWCCFVTDCFQLFFKNRN